MTSAAPSMTKRGFGATSRRDRWWVKPLLTFLGLSAFVVYSTWAAFQNAHYLSGPYLSPFYSPLLFGGGDSGDWAGVHEPLFGPEPSWWPLPFWSPAFLILWAPAGFRLTCYYYRGAYYKAFWADPPACAVGEPRKSYWGEASLPLILQNVHRYFLYLALAFIFILGYDAIAATQFEDGFGIGVGTLVLTMNVILLGGYTLGCHSFRHLVGGNVRQFSNAPLRHKSWACVTCLNKRHQMWAWFSLFWVGFTDFYVRMCSAGVWTDGRIL